MESRMSFDPRRFNEAFVYIMYACEISISNQLHLCLPLSMFIFTSIFLLES